MPITPPDIRRHPRVRSRAPRWVLAGALLCGLAGLLLEATAPVRHDAAPPRLAYDAPRRAAKRVSSAATPASSPEHVRDDRQAPSAVVHDDARWFAAAAIRPPAVEVHTAPSVAAEPPPPAKRFAIILPATTRPPAVAEEVARDSGTTRRRPRPTRRKPARRRQSFRQLRPVDSTAPRLPRETSNGRATAPPEPSAPAPGADPIRSDEVTVQTDAGVVFPTDDQAVIPIPGDAPDDGGSVSLWVEPDWQPGNADDATLVQVGDRLRVSKHGNSLHLETADGNGVFHEIDVPIPDWNAGESHHVTASWSEDDVSLYIDGELAGRRRGHRPVDLPRDSQILVGSDASDGRPVAPGHIERVDFRNRPLGDDEVASRYRDAGGDKPGRGKGRENHEAADCDPTRGASGRGDRPGTRSPS